MFTNYFTTMIETATLKDAKAWEASPEKTLFILEFFGADSISEIENWQDQLEERFEFLLAE